MRYEIVGEPFAIDHFGGYHRIDRWNWIGSQFQGIAHLVDWKINGLSRGLTTKKKKKDETENSLRFRFCVNTETTRILLTQYTDTRTHRRIRQTSTDPAVRCASVQYKRNGKHLSNSVYIEQRQLYVTPSRWTVHTTDAFTFTRTCCSVETTAFYTCVCLC